MQKVNGWRLPHAIAIVKDLTTSLLPIMASPRYVQPRVQVLKLLLGATVHTPASYMRYSTRCLRFPCLSSCRKTRRYFPVRLFATAQMQSPKPTPRFDNTSLAQMLDMVNTLLNSPTVPSQASVEGALADCESYARALYESAEDVGPTIRDENTPASTLLSLEQQQQGSTPSAQSVGLTRSTREKVVERLSSLAYSIVTDPKVFITPTALASYVATQRLIGRPETLPQVFVLYANKPIPRPGSSPARLKSANPSKASSAVPYVLADAALIAAIDAKNLPLCFDIINTSVCATAFKRNKLIRRALLPATAVALAPVAAFVLASQLSVYQNNMDQAAARNLIFAGTLAYMGFTTVLGLVALTTRNDQMNRVTWAIGLPLRERWLREEERAFIDRVAAAWGFQEETRRGEEEGQEWEALREWVGLRGMVLDRVSLMDGME